jgi:hypothetical protein
LLQKALESGLPAVRDAWEASAEKREIFWINIWQRSGGVDMLPIEGVAEIDSWARGLAGQSFAGQKMECDGYGFIVNPVGSRAQPWHVDYTLDYSTLFIPLNRLTPENCLQYAILPPEAPRSAVASALANLDVIALDPLVEACDYVSVRQLLACFRLSRWSKSSGSEIPKRRRVITGDVSHDVVYSNIVSQSAVAANDGEPVMFIFDRSSACAKMAARTSGE